MANVSSPELKNILLNVRKSYRLLFEYQQKVFNTIQFIGDTLSKNINSGYTIFGNTSQLNTGRINNKSWVWLNFYLYEVYFNDLILEHDVIKFAIEVVSDIGFFDAHADIEKMDVKSFASCEESKTKLIFIVGKNCWKPKDFNEDNDIFKAHGITEYVKGNDENGEIFMAKSYDLENFANEDYITAQLNDFISFCLMNGVNDFKLI